MPLVRPPTQNRAAPGPGAEASFETQVELDSPPPSARPRGPRHEAETEAASRPAGHPVGRLRTRDRNDGHAASLRRVLPDADHLRNLAAPVVAAGCAATSRCARSAGTRPTAGVAAGAELSHCADAPLTQVASLSNEGWWRAPNAKFGGLLGRQHDHRSGSVQRRRRQPTRYDAASNLKSDGKASYT